MPDSIAPERPASDRDADGEASGSAVDAGLRPPRSSPPSGPGGGPRRVGMGGQALRLGAVVALMVAWLLAATPVPADGIPSPIPGAVTGPAGDDLRSIATSRGLTCQADPGGAAGEVFCVAGSGEAYVQTATFFTQPALVLVASAGGTAPIDDRALPFLTAMAKPFCSSGLEDIQAFFASSVATNFSPTGYTMEDSKCRLSFNAQDASGHSFRSVTAFSLPGGVIASAEPTAGPLGSSSAAPGATARPGVGPIGGGEGPGAPGAFARSVPPPGGISTELGVLLQSGLLALAIVL